MKTFIQNKIAKWIIFTLLNKKEISDQIIFQKCAIFRTK